MKKVCLQLWLLTETVELGVLVPYPEEGKEAKDQRRPSVLHEKKEYYEVPIESYSEHQGLPACVH